MEQNFMDVVAFQKQFALAVCNALNFKFENNHVMAAFKVLGSMNMPFRQVGLANWKIVDLDLL